MVVERWQSLADADGAHGDHERAHTGRDAHVSIVDTRVYVDAHGGVVAGAGMVEIFERFCDAEFRTDWDTGLAQWGERMNPNLLERTGAQRRFDALLAVFTAAAASGVVGQFDPLVNIVVDQTTFEHHLSTLLGANPEPLNPVTVDQRRCEPAGGVQIDPADMLRCGVDRHVRGWCSTPQGWSSISVDGHGCSPVGPACGPVGDRWCMWPECGLDTGACQIATTQLGHR